MVKHLSATNHILAAAALGEEPPADAGDEVGPEAIRTKPEILTYLKGSFAHLDKAIEAIGQTNVSVNASPISPLKKGEVTRSALVVESLMHAADHYGQIVEYLRMNGIVPPASRPRQQAEASPSEPPAAPSQPVESQPVESPRPKRVTLTGGATQGNLIHRVDPAYPIAAKANRVQ